MKDRQLTDTQIENLIELVNELQDKLKKKKLQVTVLRARLNNAKGTIKRLQGIVEYQRGRIVKFYENKESDKKF
jgi:TolA-binding protein